MYSWTLLRGGDFCNTVTLVAQSPTFQLIREDMEAIDCSLTQSLMSIKNIHLRGITTEEEFKELRLGGFEIVTAAGGRAELPTHGGASKEITLHNRWSFVNMAENYKKQEFWVPVRRQKAVYHSLVGSCSSVLGGQFCRSRQQALCTTCTHVHLDETHMHT